MKAFASLTSQKQKCQWRCWERAAEKNRLGGRFKRNPQVTKNGSRSCARHFCPTARLLPDCFSNESGIYNMLIIMNIIMMLSFLPDCPTVFDQ